MRALTALVLLGLGCQHPTQPVPDGGPSATCLPRLDGPTHLDLDVRVGTVSGTVTVNGAAMPDSPAPARQTDPDERAYVVLTGAYGDLYELPVGRSGPAHFSGLVFGGTYQVDLRTVSDAQLSGLPTGVVTHLADAVAVTADLSMDFDVRLIAVSGTVTLNGAAFPDDTASRGALTFNDALNGSRYRFDVGVSGAAQYQGSVFGGTYDVTFVAGLNDDPLPHYAPVSLERERSLSSAPAARDYDVVTALVQGTVTLGGAALPDSPLLPAGQSRGTLRFTDIATLEDYVFPVGATGPGAYAGTVPKGTFSVTFVAANDQRVVGLPVFQRQPLLTALDISAPTQRDFDLNVASISGTLTLAGQPLPLSDGGTRGSIVFTQRAGGNPSFYDVAPSGPATYAGTLFAGDYDVVFVSGAGVAGMPPARPGGLELGAHVSGQRAHDYDLQLVDVAISVAIDGGELDDGGVVLADPTTGFSLELPHGQLPGTFETQLFSGAYDVRLSLGRRGQRVLQPLAPIAPGLMPLAFEVSMFEVDGTLTLNGAAIADGPRGTLELDERITHWPVPVVLDQSGPAALHGRLLEGTYNVRLLSDVMGPTLGMPASVQTQIATGCAR